VLLAVHFAGCISPVAPIAPPLPQHYTEAGTAHGSACGLLLLDLIPIGVNDRAARAYTEALHSANATVVADVSTEDSWYFVLVGTLLCTDISGQGIRASP
jgi:hypothetical protein